VLFRTLNKAMNALEEDWAAEMRVAIARARRTARSVPLEELSQTCLVWEVQRSQLALGADSTWQRPWLPTDSEQKHGWMDKDLQRRHPQLDTEVSNSDEAQEPPVAMLPIWTATGNWRVTVNENTDRDGWQYGTDWNTSAWRPVPRPLFDLVRRRKWERRYELRMSDSNSQLIDSQWLRRKSGVPAPSGWRELFGHGTPGVKVKKQQGAPSRARAGARNPHPEGTCGIGVPSLPASSAEGAQQTHGQMLSMFLGDG